MWPDLNGWISPRLRKKKNVSKALSLSFLSLSLPAFVLLLSVFLWYFLIPSPLSPLFSPSGVLALLCVWRNLKTKNQGGKRRNNSLWREDKRRKHPEEIIKIFHLTLLLFHSVVTPLSSLLYVLLLATLQEMSFIKSTLFDCPEMILEPNKWRFLLSLHHLYFTDRESDTSYDLASPLLSSLSNYTSILPYYQYCLISILQSLISAVPPSLLPILPSNHLCYLRWFTTVTADSF